MLVAGVTVGGVPAIADVPGVVGVSAVPFEHAVAGGPVVTGFPAVDGVLAVASIPVDHGVSSLANGFTYRTFQCTMRHIRLYYFFLLSEYRNIEYRVCGFKLSAIGATSQSYRTIVTQEKLLVAHLCKMHRLPLTTFCQRIK